MRFVFQVFIASICLVSCQKKSEKVIPEDLSTYTIKNADLKNELTNFIIQIDSLSNKNISFSTHKKDCFLIDFGTIVIENEPSDTLVFIYNAKPYNCASCKGMLSYMGKKVFFSSPFDNLDGIIEVTKPFNDCEKYSGGEFDMPPQASWKFSKGKLLRFDQ